jgi:AraC-like DNA-binding protein
MVVSMKQHPKITLSDDEADLLESYFQVLCQQMRDQDAFLYNDIVRSLIGTFLLRILSYYRTKNEQEEDAQENPVLSGKQLADRFVAMVEKSEGRIRRVDDFARRLNVSPKYLSTVLQDTINRRPSEIIAIFTMKAIEQRLRFTNQTMQEIAHDMNFPNASFFGKYVKAHLGMTPMDFRRKYANTNS